MKLKKFLPITLLALLALVSCDPTVDPTDSDDPTTDPVVPETLAEILARLDEGVASEEDLYLILDNIDQASEGINDSIIQRMEGYDPRVLVDPSQAYMEVAKGYGSIDGDAVEIGVAVELSLAEPSGSSYVLGEPFLDREEVVTVWDDGEEVHLTNLSAGDVDDDYSFAVSADSDDVDIDDFKSFVNSGSVYDYLSLADEAYTYYSGSDEFVEVKLIAQAEKVLDAENGDYLHLRYLTLGSWLGFISAEGQWGPGNEGLYVERGEVWGFEAIISVDGIFEMAYNYNGHFVEYEYLDLNWKEGDPSPTSATDYVLDDLDLVYNAEYWGFIYDITQFLFGYVDDLVVELPDIDDYRGMDETDSTYFFDPVDYGFEI